MIKNFLKKILGIKSPSKLNDLISPAYPNYVEKDTKCDLCDNRSECKEYLIDCTHSADTRRNVLNGIGHFCPLDIREYFTAYPEASKIIFDIMSENDISEQYKTCGRCIHDGESSDIVGCTCYMCKRNPDDHRIDWFEKREDTNE